MKMPWNNTASASEGEETFLHKVLHCIETFLNILLSTVNVFAYFFPKLIRAEKYFLAIKQVSNDMTKKSICESEAVARIFHASEETTTMQEGE